MSVEKLREIMAQLRDPEHGCPWDKKQNFSTIAPFTVEEAYEVADVIEREAWAELPGELGDLLFQVVYHAQMAQEQGWFGFDEVVTLICEKMIRRHPHVFGDETLKTDDQIKGRWEEIKQAERLAGSEKAVDRSALAGVTRALPALTLASKVQKKAARVGFDWPEIAPVIEKVNEELAEIKVEIAKESDKTRIIDEMGDLLFSCVNLARHLKIDPEQALRQAVAKFENRFRRVETEVWARNQELTDLNADELDVIWEGIKKLGKS